MTRALAIPSPRAWLETGVLWLGFVALAAPVAALAGLLPGRVALDDPLVIARLLLLPLLIPALAEELFFRGMLYPHPDEPLPPRRRLGWAGVSLTAYLIAHPLNAWLLRPAARDTFFDPWFLLLVVLLGLTALLAYQRSRSLWPAVAVHYLTVTPWLLWGGATLIS